MIPHSDNFKKALLSPIKRLYIQIKLFDNKMNFIDSIEKEVTSNDIGSISVDTSRAVRRNFNFSLVNKDNKYTWNENSILWIDKRVQVFTGLKLSDGSIEYIPQGVFCLTEPITSNVVGQGCITTISGQDKTYLFTDKRGKLVSEYIIEEGVNVATAIKILAQSEGETHFLFDEVTETVPYELTYSGTDNKWNVMSDLSQFAKCQLYYDTNGYLRLQSIRDLDQIQNEAAVWTFKKGDMFYAGNVRKMDETNLYNDFFSLGGGTETEVVSHRLTVSEVQNPELWAGCPYSIEKIGRATYFHNEGNSDPLLTTTDECMWRNKYELLRHLGYSERVQMSIAPLFILDVSDIIQIEDNENGTTGRYMIEKFDIPLKPQLVTVECAKETFLISDWNFM